MNLLLNIVFAWISVGLAFCLSIIWLLRVLNKKFYNNKNRLLGKINHSLRKSHIIIGILLIVTSLVHGLYSSFKVLGLNAGTIAVVCAILLGFTYMFRKALIKIKGWIKWHRILTVCFVILLVIHIVEVGGFVGADAIKLSMERDLSGQSQSINMIKNNVDMSGNKYKDGTYTGVGTGYGPELTVEVTIKSNEITNVEIVSHNEKQPRFYQKAFDTVPGEIIDAQSPAVDVVTGATFSSYGIMGAVNNALSQALISGNLPTIDNSNLNSGKRGHDRFPGGAAGSKKPEGRQQ